MGAQVEESYIGAEDFCRKANQEEALLLKGETILLEALGFDLIVFSPYRPLQGLITVGISQSIQGYWRLPCAKGQKKRQASLKAHSSRGSMCYANLQDLAELEPSMLGGSEAETSKEEHLEIIRGKAVGAADALMLTDAPLLFPPGQLALAALRRGIQKVCLTFDFRDSRNVDLHCTKASFPKVNNSLLMSPNFGSEPRAEKLFAIKGSHLFPQAFKHNRTYPKRV